MANLRCIVVILTTLGWSSCLKKEIPIIPHESGNLTTTTIALSGDYRYQVFYSIERDEEVSRNLKTDWDIAIESGEGNHIILNGSKAMYLVSLPIEQWSAVINTNNLDWIWDVPSGNLDSTAFGEWYKEERMYIIDRGYDWEGKHLGYKKVKFDEQKSIIVSELDGSTEIAYAILKDTACNYSYLSFDKGWTTIAPPKNEWDLVFTQYTHVFYDEPQPTAYLVSGVLSNPSRIKCYEGGKFEEVNLELVQTLWYVDDVNIIGYDWKEFNFDTESYIIYPEKCYILKTTSGKFYKLHFIDFYNKSGEKGYPTFEFQEL